MTSRHSASSVSRRHVELALAAPQVIARRTMDMVAAGASPSQRDRAEFTRMFTEKSAAFSQAWLAGWMALWSAPFRVAAEMMRAGTFAAGRGVPMQALAQAWQRQGWQVAGAGLAPVHRTAVANARRLAKRG